VGVVDEAIEDGVSVGWVTDHLMPPGHRKLAGNERRAMPVSVLEDFQQVVASIAVERFEAPVIEDEQVNAGKAFHACGDAAITFCKGQFVDQPWQPRVEDRAVVATSLVAKRTGKPAFADPGRPDNLSMAE
jgi:hypothetical protein